MLATSLDHVALWVADREGLAGFLREGLGVHEISRGHDFTLLGADARRGKLTLFDAPGPREAGVLGRVVLRVADLEAALRRLPAGTALEYPAPGLATFTGPENLGLGLVAASGDGPDYDLDHVLLRVPQPEHTFAELAELGFAPEDGRLVLGERHLRVELGRVPAGERPLLNHVALLVESADDLRAEAERRRLDVERFVDAENTRAVFVRGPDRITLEYVEHKPGFSLA